MGGIAPEVCVRCGEPQFFKPLPGLEDRYWVSQCGDVLSLRGTGPQPHYRATPKKLTPNLDTMGYLMVGISVGRKDYRPMGKINRLVALAHLGYPPSGRPMAAHGDGDRRNNCLPNIRWASASENAQDSIKHGTMARWGKKHSRVLTPSKVKRIRELLSGGMPQRAIASKFGVTQPVVWQIKTGRSWRGVGDVAVR